MWILIVQCVSNVQKQEHVSCAKRRNKQRNGANWMITFWIWKSPYSQKLSKIWLWKDTLSEPRCLINFLSNMCSWLGASSKTKLLNVCSIIFFSFENRIEILPGNFFGAIPLPTNLDKCCSVNGEAMSENMPQSKYFGKYRYLGTASPAWHRRSTTQTSYHSSAHQRETWKSEDEKGSRLTKLSREKLVERRAWKLSELKKGKEIFPHISEYNTIFANILAGTIQRRFGRRTCRWPVGSMSPRLRVQLINRHLPNHLLFPI